jgi:exosortase
MAVADHKRFLVWLILAVAAWWPALRVLVSTAMGDENYSYTLLVLGVSVALLCFERWDIPTKQTWPLSELCLAVPVLAVAAWLNFRTTFAAGDLSLTLSIFLWIASILAIFANVYGWHSFSRLRFPLLFSLLAVPLPERAISALITTLQWGSADAANLLFRLFRVPVVRDGLVFSFTEIEIEVARECSSIRSSTILVVTSLVIAQLFLKSNSSKWIAFLVSLPVAVFKNGLRIFTLSLLGEYVSTSWLDSWFHHQGGFIFLAVGLGMMLIVIWLLWRAEVRRVRLAE